MDVTLSDEELVSGAIQGDRAAFAALLTRHYDMMFRVAWKWCGNQTDAEDIAQDVAIRLGQSIRSFSGDARFSSWLYRVVLNAVRDFQRKRQAETRKEVAYLAEPTRPDVQAAEAPDDPADALWQAVRKLPQKQREAVTLVYGEGLSHKQACEIMECAESTVSFHIHEAKKELKRLMTESGRAGVK